MENDLLFIHGYKEPLTKVETGFGYYGTISGTKDKQFIQCHECGRLFKNLSFHIKQAHKYSVKEYRVKFQLSAQTSLVSEEKRNQLKQFMFDRFHNMTEEQKKAFLQRGKDALKKNHFTFKKGESQYSLEKKNQLGICPAQLLDKLVKVAKELGKTPTMYEFIEVMGTQKFSHHIYQTFGNWENYVLKAGLEKGIPKDTRRNFYKYTDDELLDYLFVFWKEQGRVPTSSDGRRGLIPNVNNYQRFGGIQKARKLAGIEDWYIPKSFEKHENTTRD